MKIATARILRLRRAKPTVGAVGANFLRRRIAPLQERKRPAWEFENAADIMRLRPGLNFNFTVLELNAMLQELFKYDPDHPEVFRLPRGGRPAVQQLRAQPHPRNDAAVRLSWDWPNLARACRRRRAAVLR